MIQSPDEVYRHRVACIKTTLWIEENMTLTKMAERLMIGAGRLAAFLDGVQDTEVSQRIGRYLAAPIATWKNQSLTLLN